MAAQQASRFLRVGDVIAAFVAQGCIVLAIEAEIRDPDGDVTNLRELRRPETGDFVALIDLDDDDKVPDDEVAFWEDRLGLTIPRN